MEKQGYLITRTMVYGTETPQIPDGWEDTGEFRPPMPHEASLLDNGGGGWWHVCESKKTEPRIILRKKRVRKVVFTEVGRRRVANGEFYEYGGEIRLNDTGLLTVLPFHIFTREEVLE